MSLMKEAPSVNEDVKESSTPPHTPMKPLPGFVPSSPVEESLRQRALPDHVRLIQGADPEAIAAREFLYGLGLTEETLREYLIGLQPGEWYPQIVFPDLRQRGGGENHRPECLDSTRRVMRAAFDPNTLTWRHWEHSRQGLAWKFDSPEPRADWGLALYPVAQARTATNSLIVCDDPIEALLCRQLQLNTVAAVGHLGQFALNETDLAEAVGPESKGVYLTRRVGVHSSRTTGILDPRVEESGWHLIDLSQGRTLIDVLSGVHTVEDLEERIGDSIYATRDLCMQFGGDRGLERVLEKPGPVDDLLAVSGAQRSQSGGPPAFYTGADLADNPDDEPEFIAEFVPAGALVDLIGLPKVGKSTFISDMVRAVIKGEPFLGRPTNRSPVVYLSEQSKASFRETVKRVGLGPVT